MSMSEEDEAKVQEVINRLGRSEPWLRRFAEDIGVTYVELLEHARDFILNGDRWVSDGSQFMNVTATPEFWEHFQDVTNIQVPIDQQEDFFGCAC